MSENTLSIALLSQGGESGRHLRDALAASGAPVVYESQAADLDRDALEKSGARVVVVNLDSETEAHLDEVYALLDDDRYNVIFNEPQVSSQLSGWEQARWARHLAAKILGVENADPPRPPGSEPVPQPVAKSIAMAPSFVEPANAAASDIDLEALAPAGVTEFAGSEDHVERNDSNPEVDPFADIVALLGETELPDASNIQDIPVGSSDTMPALDLSEFDSFTDVSVHELTFDDEDVGDPGSSLANAAVPEFAPTIEMPIVEPSSGDTDAVLGFGDLDDFADDAFEVIEIDSESSPVSVTVDSDLAASVDAGEAAATGSALSDLQLLDLDWTDPPEAPSGVEAEASTEVIETPALGSAFAWSLESLDEVGDDANITEGAESARATFGIETISATEYLAPDAEEDGEEAFEEGISLELIPLEDAVAHSGPDRVGETSSESWLDTENKVAVSRVWVLGASIGGPEAVREFLADIPAKCPALFLLAQHMGAEFMEIMAQQLVRSTRLTVRTPSHGERVSHGDIVIVPTTHRLRVDRAGVVTLEAQPASDRQNSPSIDQVLQDVADRFGARAGAIIFSGMAEDAAEGSRYLTEIGGTVYAQDPETCVISSMVDGVIDTGVVSFVGSPKALASKLLGELSANTKT